MHSTDNTKTLYASQALLVDGWADNVAVEIDGNGLISSLSTDLYSRSGTEAGVSNNSVKLKETNGDYYPVKAPNKQVPKILYW